MIRSAVRVSASSCHVGCSENRKQTQPSIKQCVAHQFVPADWSSNMGDAFAPSCGQDDVGLVELLCGGHVVMPRQEHEAAPWFDYPVGDGSPDMDLFSEIFGEMQAADDGRAAGLAGDAMSYHAAAKTGKRKQRDTAESPMEFMQDAEGSDSTADAVTMCGSARRPATGKRRRAAQEHNLSERRRRDRINEKMRALQELIPHCNKTDKASMLDEAIDYLKSLQLRVQMMWTTGGAMPALAPATFPASSSHRYMRSRMPPFSRH